MENYYGVHGQSVLQCWMNNNNNNTDIVVHISSILINDVVMIRGKALDRVSHGNVQCSPLSSLFDLIWRVLLKNEKINCASLLVELFLS